MRAGRMAPERPQEEQTAWIFGINDRAMRKYVTTKRVEAQRAIRLLEESGGAKTASDVSAGSGEGPRLVYHGISLEGIAGIGFGHNGYSAELDEEVADDNSPVEDNGELFTEKEKREQLRRRRHGLVNQYAGKLHGQVNGDTIRQVNALLLQRFGKPVNLCSPEELLRQIAWLESTLGLAVEVEKPAEKPPVSLENEKVEYVQAGLF